MLVVLDYCTRDVFEKRAFLVTEVLLQFKNNICVNMSEEFIFKIVFWLL